MISFKEVVTSLKVASALRSLSKTMLSHLSMEKYQLLLLKEDLILVTAGMKAIWSTEWHKVMVFLCTPPVNMKATDTKVKCKETDLMVRELTLSRLAKTRKLSLVSSSTVV